jgi:hypothetical protein
MGRHSGKAILASGLNFSACAALMKRQGKPIRTFAMTRVFIVAAAAASALLTTPASAEVQYPWCAQYRWPIDATNCGFVSYPQCMATVSGVGGYCYQNPAYPPPRQRRPRR